LNKSNIKNLFFSSSIKILQDNKQILFFFLLLFVSSLIRIPYFIYLSEPDFGGDVNQYYSVTSYFSNEKVRTVGYPTVGYPFYLRMCELIDNTTSMVVIGQNFLSILSLSLFYFAITSFFKKYYLFISIVLIGFSTSNATLAYESAYYPDSILSSLLIISLAILFFYLNNRKVIWLYLLSFVIVLAVAVRPSSILFYILFILFFIWLLYTKKITMKKGVILLGALVFFSLSLALYNYLSPIYKQFNIITYPSQQLEVENKSPVFEYLNLLEVNELFSLIPNDKYPFSAVKKIRDGNLDEKFEYYRNYLMYGLCFKFEDDKLVGNISGNSPIYIDSFFIKNNSKKNKFLILKEKLKIKYKKKEMYYVCPIENELKFVNFRYFFKYFYIDKVKTELVIYDEYNQEFYSRTLRIRWGGHYVNNYLGNQYLDEMKSNPKDILFKSIVKEKKYTKKGLEDLDEKYWKMKTSLIYRLFLHPIELIQPILFRNIIYPIVYFIVLIYSLFLFIKNRGKEVEPFIALLGCSMLLIINVLHSCHFSFLYFRYTHSVSFIYYFTMIMLPFLIFYKNKSLNNA